MKLESANIIHSYGGPNGAEMIRIHRLFADRCQQLRCILFKNVFLHTRDLQQDFLPILFTMARQNFTFAVTALDTDIA